MPNERRLVAERLVAGITLKGSLPCMDPLMDHHVGLLSELLPTLRAGIWPLSSVDSAMDSQFGHLKKTLAALRADVGLFSGVRFPVLR